MQEKIWKNPIILSVRKTAELLGETEPAVRMKIYRKQIPHRRWGKRVFIFYDELFEFLRSTDGCGIEEALQHVEGGE